MTRAAAWPRAVVTLLLLGPVAAACGTAADVDDDELSRWMNERSGTSTDSLGHASALIGADDSEPSPDDGVTLTFEEPERVDGVILACVGPDTVAFSLRVTTEAGSTSLTYPDVPCGHGDHEETLDLPGLTSVTVNGTGAGPGAWSATLLGGDAS